MRHTVVAIDGPAASGKSSTAAAVAATLGFRHVDSGALYRAVTFIALRSGAPPELWSPALLLDAARHVELAVGRGGSVQVLVDSLDVGEALRSERVTQLVSGVARTPAVRQWVTAVLRDLASRTPLVVDGRDIGTAVFPDADLKVYLIAAPRERARRRLRQTLGREPTEAELVEEERRLVERDERDAAQSAPAADAVLLDTTALAPEEQVQRILALLRDRAASRGEARG
ncbi:MAG TPA: (d)CMP kinase [Gemmatimonadaceae bacterium]|nr:(d)CMP kinase [Gemmatimonadaceae bacterium]